MPDVKMTRKQFFEEYKKAVAAYEGSKCAEEWLALANTVTDEDLVNGDEVITVDAGELNRLGSSANRSNALGANDEIAKYFGLSTSKLTAFLAFGYSHAQNGIGGVVSMATGTLCDNIVELDKNAAQTEFRKEDKVYELNGMIRDAFAACDDMGIVNKNYSLKFYDLSAKSERNLNAKEVNDMLAEGRVVYARHADFGDIPLVKDVDGKIVSGDKLMNRPAYEPKKTEIPKVKGIWNKICSFLHIRTAGTKEYFEAKDLEKARNAEAKKKNDELKKAQDYVRKDPKFETAKVMNIDEEIKKQNAQAKNNPENQISEKAKIAMNDIDKWQAELIGAFLWENHTGEINVYADSHCSVKLNPASANKHLNEGSTLFATCGKSIAYKFNLLGENGSLLFGRNAAIAEKAQREKITEAIRKDAMGKIVENIDELFVLANGIPKRKHGEDRREWQEKAYIKLSTDEKYQFGNLESYEKDEYADKLDEWVGKNRKKIIDAYTTACDNEHLPRLNTAVRYLENELNGSKLFNFIEAKQNEHIVKYANPEREKKLQAILDEQKKKEEASEVKGPETNPDEQKAADELKEKKESHIARENEKSLKGQELVDEKRNAAYEVIMDFGNNYTDDEVLDALATVVVCHTISPKTGLETDFIAGKNVDMRMKIEESRAQGIKAREIISGNEKAFENAVEQVKGTEAFKFYADEYKNAMAVRAQKGEAKSFFVAKKAVIMTKKLLEEHNIGGNIEPLKAGVLAAESQLITGLDEKNKELSLGVSDIVKNAITNPEAGEKVESLNDPMLKK